MLPANLSLPCYHKDSFFSCSFCVVYLFILLNDFDLVSCRFQNFNYSFRFCFLLTVLLFVLLISVTSRLFSFFFYMRWGRGVLLWSLYSFFGLCFILVEFVCHKSIFGLIRCFFVFSSCFPLVASVSFLLCFLSFMCVNVLIISYISHLVMTFFVI